ncbi:hypothetical protein DPMN_107250 [Dreissena polymorpha]|uniref:Uncharacterized protein n=1 Tax=Dreissena polymorpha TaxID=45954 RepID=A0A9D4K6N6_DREPO|nr:hypothetical protein DPMN_107250 [Dreissena polymorpha]
MKNFQQTVTIFELSQAMNTTNLRTKFNEDWAINITSRVLTSKAAPPPGGHIFSTDQNHFQTQPSYHKNKYWTINVTPRVLTSKTALPPGSHVFLPILTIFKLNRCTQETNVRTKFHEDWTKNVTSRAFTCFHYIHIEKTAPPPGGHFHDDWAKIVTSRVFIRNTAPPPGGHVFQWTETIFELNQYIIKTNILTKLHEDWAFQCDFYSIIGTNALTKFHEDRTIMQMLTTHARRTAHDGQKLKTVVNLLTRKTAPAPGSHVFRRTGTIFRLNQAIKATNVLPKKTAPPPGGHNKYSTINVTPRVITRKTALPSGGHIFQRTGTILKLNQAFPISHQGSSVDQTLLVCDGFHVVSLPCSHSQLDALSAALFLALPLMPKAPSAFHTDYAGMPLHPTSTRKIQVVYPLSLHIAIIETNVMTKLHEDWTIN